MTGGAQRQLARSERLRGDVLRLHGPSHEISQSRTRAVSSFSASAVHVRLHGIALDVHVKEHAPFCFVFLLPSCVLRLGEDLRGKVEEEVRADAERGASPEPVQNQNAFRRVFVFPVVRVLLVGDRSRFPEIEAHRRGDALRLSQGRARRGVQSGGDDVVVFLLRALLRLQIFRAVRLRGGAFQRLHPGVALAPPASRRGEHEPPPTEHEVELAPPAGVPARRARDHARVRQRRREVNRQRRRASPGGHRGRRIASVAAFVAAFVAFRRLRLLRQQNELPGDAQRRAGGPPPAAAAGGGFRVRERDAAYSAHQRARPEQPRVEARDDVLEELGVLVLDAPSGETREDHTQRARVRDALQAVLDVLDLLERSPSDAQRHRRSLSRAQRGFVFIQREGVFVLVLVLFLFVAHEVVQRDDAHDARVHDLHQPVLARVHVKDARDHSAARCAPVGGHQAEVPQDFAIDLLLRSGSSRVPASRRGRRHRVHPSQAVSPRPERRRGRSTGRRGGVVPPTSDRPKAMWHFRIRGLVQKSS